MDWLPKDIANIIHRYIVGYNYNNVVAQYKSKWAKYWSDIDNMFPVIGRPILRLANWRALPYSHVIRNAIYNFTNEFKAVAYLPICY